MTDRDPDVGGSAAHTTDEDDTASHPVVGNEPAATDQPATTNEADTDTASHPVVTDEPADDIPTAETVSTDTTPGDAAMDDPVQDDSAPADARLAGAATPATTPADTTAADTHTAEAAPVPTPADDEAEREAERARVRAAERSERNRALGKVDRRPAPEPPPAVLETQVRTTDRWHGALGLFVVRLVLGVLMLVHGIQHVTSLSDTQAFIDQSTVLPYPEILVWVLAIGELLIGLALVLGLLVRVAAVGAMAVSALALVFVLWGVGNPFTPGETGFTGELELLIFAVGLLLLLVGGGRWGVDGAFRSRRRLKREARATA